MGNFLTALANIGSQYAEGRVAGQEEKEKLAQEKARTGLEQTQQQLERQRLDMQMQQLAQYKAEAPLRELQTKAELAKAKYYDIYVDGKRRTMDVGTGKLVSPEDQGLADPKNAALFKQAQAYISGQDSSIQPELNRLLTVGWALRQPWDDIFKSLEGNVKAFTQEQRIEQRKGSTAGTTAYTPEEVKQSFKGIWDPDIEERVSRRIQMELSHNPKNPAAVLQQGFQEGDALQKAKNTQKAKDEAERRKGQELTAASSKAITTTLPTLAQANDLLKDIKKFGLENNNENMYFTQAYAKYRAGIRPPVHTLKDDMAAFSLGSVVEATAALQGATRAYSALQLALIHTPNPVWDSPSDMYRKLQEISMRLTRIVAFNRIFGTKGNTPPLDVALRMVGTPENEIQMMMTGLGPTGQPLATMPLAVPATGNLPAVPAPVASPATDVTPPAAPAGGALSPAAQAVYDSLTNKPSAGRPK